MSALENARARLPRKVSFRKEAKTSEEEIVRAHSRRIAGARRRFVFTRVPFYERVLGPSLSLLLLSHCCWAATPLSHFTSRRCTHARIVTRRRAQTRRPESMRRRERSLDRRRPRRFSPALSSSASCCYHLQFAIGKFVSTLLSGDRRVGGERVYKREQYGRKGER